MTSEQIGSGQGLTPKEMATANRVIRMCPCRICKAKKGQNCRGIQRGTFHMGRLPVGFDIELAAKGISQFKRTTFEKFGHF